MVAPGTWSWADPSVETVVGELVENDHQIGLFDGANRIPRVGRR
jgi:hypothetical protein